MQLTTDMQQGQARRQAVRRIETALGLITTGLAHRDRQIRDAILSELAGTTAHSELLTKPVESLNAIASTVSQLGRRIRDGFAYDTLLELQTEARAIFLKLDGAR
jgi:hypothetical protein